MSSPPLIIGLTGNIGSGKSTVARLWEPHNCHLIDGDILGRRAVDESASFRDWLRQRFGAHLFDGARLNRAELGRIVFRDKQARDDLNAAIWPPIRELLEAEIDSALQNGQHALVDAAMIVEWGDEARYDVLVAVVVDPETGAQRAANRMGRPAAEMMDRYRMQVPAEIKAERADVVLHNDSTPAALGEAAVALWPKVLEMGADRARQRRT